MLRAVGRLPPMPIVAQPSRFPLVLPADQSSCDRVGGGRSPGRAEIADCPGSGFSADLRMAGAGKAPAFS
jgi:hypothetical protein